MLRIFFVALLVTLAAANASASQLSKDLDRQIEESRRQRCGDLPDLSWTDKMFKTAKYAAYERFLQCQAQIDAENQRAYEQIARDNESFVRRVHQACDDAIKRLSRAPDTLSFAGYNYDPLGGYSSANIDSTVGGYFVDVSGSDINGNFKARCYMDKNLRVTAVK